MRQDARDSRYHSWLGGAIGAFVLIALAGCGTTQTPLQTPFGPTPTGKAFVPLQVLGVINLDTNTGALANADTNFITNALVEVPVGTVLVIPALRGWSLNYGEIKPVAGSSESFTWAGVDHNYGLGGVRVAVVRVNPVNTALNPPQQTAELAIHMILTDDDHDDAWMGSVQYTLICLGPGVSAGAMPPITFEPPKFAICPRNACGQNIP